MCVGIYLVLKWRWKLNLYPSNKTWFLYYHQLFISVSCGTVILSWTSTLHKEKTRWIIKYYILRHNCRKWLKIKIESDVYCRNILISPREKSVKVPHKPVFLCIYAFMHLTENLSHWAIKSDTFILPVLLLKLQK